MLPTLWDVNVNNLLAISIQQCQVQHMEHLSKSRLRPFSLQFCRHSCVKHSALGLSCLMIPMVNWRRILQEATAGIEPLTVTHLNKHASCNIEMHNNDRSICPSTGNIMQHDTILFWL